MTLSGQSTPDIAVARTTDVAPPLQLELLLLLLVVAALALPASFARIRNGDEICFLNGNCTETYRLGVVLPWKRGTHTWNKTAGRDQWGHESFTGERLAVHLAFHSLVWGVVILLLGPVIRQWARRRGVTRGVPASVEQAALARWGRSASGPWGPSVCRPGSHLGPPPGATTPSGPPIS
jgi:hypothetical protein